MQEEIIRSVIVGKDTLALLPTGGGKSICFQVPALASERLCIVVTPLIALMKDQVENLKKKGIRAAAIYSGMTKNEIEVVVSNAVTKSLQFLYLSPERLETDIITMNIERMNISLIAVDEAHCISQWGYDFRPSYLKIAEIRKYLPLIPILALTATATPNVVEDIQNQLLFKSPNVFQQSFERKNLTYIVQKEEDKFNRLIKIISRVPGSGIVYMRSRNKTREIADFLKSKNISSDFYHAGLEMKERSKKQTSWMKGYTRIMVATNAFGMGIDKPDVRFVVHLDVPDSLEAYFQEAGRGGRDEKRSYAALLFDNSDILDAQQNLKLQFPEIKTIQQVYHALGSHYQLAIGSGKDTAFEFDINEFSTKYNFKLRPTINAIKLLEKEGYLLLQDVIDNDSKVYISASKEDLYKFQVENASYDKFIKTLLRSYSGLMTNYTKISETELAGRLGLDPENVEKKLLILEKFEILKYQKRKNKPQIIFLTERLDGKDILMRPEHYRDRIKSAETRLQATLHYLQNSSLCRSRQLLKYFGEIHTTRCGRCDVCIEQNKLGISNLEFDKLQIQIEKLLIDRPLTIKQIAEKLQSTNEDKIIKVVQWLMDNQQLFINEEKKLAWKP
jgi:ATP-dependent DNA helicase RecQ